MNLTQNQRVVVDVIVEHIHSLGRGITFTSRDPERNLADVRALLDAAISLLTALGEMVDKWDSSKNAPDP
jgi:hypothetical protein